MINLFNENVNLNNRNLFLLKKLFTYFQGICSVNRNESKNKIVSQTLNENLKLISDKNQKYNCFSKEVQNQLEELYEYDNEINELLFNKILQFENENKFLKDENKRIQMELVELKKSMQNARRYSEKLKLNYKLLEEKKDLLIKLQSTNKKIQQSEAELSGAPPLKRRKTTEESIDNHNVTSKSCFVNEGLVVI